ncbi:VOC family protein [Mucilaginibacter sp.]|uniref:VOC family protein n=1 Tax=Mucilaginibacter sp. TaxID=1882438 RepID=UPI003AFFBC67
MTKLSVYFGLNGRTEEAMDFYKNCFGGEPILTIIGDSDMKDHFPEAMKDKVLHAELHTDGFTIMASDMNGPDGFTEGTNVAISLDNPDPEKAKQLYNKLAVGGTIMDDFKPQFWGGMMGVVRDKFGIKWMLSSSANS